MGSLFDRNTKFHFRCAPTGLTNLMALRCDLAMMSLAGALNLLWNPKAAIFGFMVCHLTWLAELP
jgi:hypothetical protein